MKHSRKVVTMTDNTIKEMELLSRIKDILMITGNYHDEVLKSHIEEVKEYMKAAGVSEDIANSKISVGVIARGVSDLWNYGSGTATFSPYFKERVIQLAFTKEKSSEGSE